MCGSCPTPEDRPTERWLETDECRIVYPRVTAAKTVQTGHPLRDRLLAHGGADAASQVGLGDPQNASAPRRLLEEGDGGEVLGEVVEGVVLEPVLHLFGGEPGEQQVRAQLWRGGACLAQEVGAVLPPECVRAGPEPGAGPGGLGQQDQIQLAAQEHQVGGDEGGEPIDRGGPGSQRGRAGQDRLLKLAFALVE